MAGGTRLDALALQVVFAGAIGWMLMYLLSALGKRELAGLLKVLTVVMVVIGVIKLIGETIQAVCDAPLVKLIERGVNALERWFGK